MDVFVNAAGKYVCFDGSRYRFFNSQQEARDFMQTYDIGEAPADIEIAYKLTKDILPNLRKYIFELLAIEATWNANGISHKIEQAISIEQGIGDDDQNDEAVAAEDVTAAYAAAMYNDVGRSAATIASIDVYNWILWDKVMKSLKQWMNTPIDETGVTPLMILSIKNVKKEQI